MSNHDHIEPSLDAYLAGGLSPDERHEIEQHCEACSACARQLIEGKQVDQLMNDLFVQLRPGADLETRTLKSLHGKTIKPRHGIMYFVLSAAAVIALGLIGAAAQAMVERSDKRREYFAQANSINEDERHALAFHDPFEGRNPTFKAKTDPAAAEFDADINYMNDRIADVSVPGSNNGKLEGKRLKFSLDVKNSFTPPPSNAPGRIRDYDGSITGPTSNGTLIPDPKVGNMDGEKNMPPGNLPTPGLGVGGFAGGGFYGVNIAGPMGPSGGGGGAPSGASKPLAASYYGRVGSTNTIRSEPESRQPDKNAPMKASESGKSEGGSEVKGGDVAKAEKAPYFFSPDGAFAKQNPPKAPPGDNPPSGKEGDQKAEQKKEEQIAKLGGDVAAQPPPENAGRKIIRTGEMEFETDSFDSAINGVTALIAKVKGGFIATINSDKLPNGKVRGSIVVRMPPEFLDKFILDLRRDLGKTGELKGQRIGSQDVTKQFTDIESELRAARAVETRLIEIIKTGKGEIKDLIAAERELGTWRTKIEKMEGEIRYYNNQVSLSTLTITLYEKEILSALAMVMRERVQMNIEVEEVEKAQDSIAAAVKAAKGRIVKNDLNVGEAGQVSAIVHAEVPPDSAPLFRELLKKLGTVSRHQAERTQQAEGGTSKSHELKTRQDDVRFELSLYNTANIKPRETLHYKLGAADVTESYRKVRAAILKFKGQVRKAHLDEQDKLNVSAELNFTVGATDREAFDKIVADAGFVVTKHTIQAAINETATDRKVGYELTLLSTLNIKPRETYQMKIAAQDVTASYRKLRDAVEAAKGQVRRANLDEKDRLDVIAELAFHIAITERGTIDKLLAEIGFVVNRQTVQAAVNEISTDRTVGYELNLRNVAAIPPRDIYTIHVASQDVPTSYRKLHDAVTLLKGRVHKGQLNEQDKFNVSAVLDFDLATADKPALDKLIGEIGVTISRNNDQFPSKDDSTDQKVGYRMTLKNVAGATPREKAILALRVSDVDARALQLKELILASKGRVMFSKSERNKNGEMKMVQIFELPHASLETIVRQIKDGGTLLIYDKEMNPQVPDNELATAQIVLTLVTLPDIVPTSEDGIWWSLRKGLSTAGDIFSWGIVVLISGLAIVVPWLIPIWIIVWLIRRNRAASVKPEVSAVATKPSEPSSV